MDKLSYALGLSMAQNFKGSGIQSINADDFAEALRAVYEDKEKKMRVEDLGLSLVLVSEEGEREREKDGKGERRCKVDTANVKLQVANLFCV